MNKSNPTTNEMEITHTHIRKHTITIQENDILGMTDDQAVTKDSFEEEPIRKRAKTESGVIKTREPERSSSQSIHGSKIDNLSGLPTHSKTKVSFSGYGSLIQTHIKLSERYCLTPTIFGDYTNIREAMSLTGKEYFKDVDLLSRHPNLNNKSRSIVLHWLMNVCDAKHFHRETLYLAVDYLDRYLSTQKDVLMKHLQQLGITCLFLAAKMEETYPPGINFFVDVTDGACSEQDILFLEPVIMKALKWKLSPITPSICLNLYLQILTMNENQKNYQSSIGGTSRPFRETTAKDELNLMRVGYNGLDFVRAMRVIDLTILDVNSLQFNSALLAAASIYHTLGETSALTSSGFSLDQIRACVLWMGPYATEICKESLPDALPMIKNVPYETRHFIQSHCVALGLLANI